MTLDTRIYILDKIDYRQVFVQCNQLIGAHEGVRFTDEPVPSWENGERQPGSEDGEWFIWNEPGQGLSALLDVHYKRGAALRVPAEHWRYCEPAEDSCTGGCAPACWLEVSFDTAYGYKDEHGGCGELHARLVFALGQWLDEKGVRWKWQNEFTGEIHDGYENLDGLTSGGDAAAEWFSSTVLPAIQRQ